MWSCVDIANGYLEDLVRFCQKVSYVNFIVY